MRKVVATLALALALAALVARPAAAAAAPPPPIQHVFIIVLENKDYDVTWGSPSPSPYLGTDLRAQGNLLTQYFATSHNSLGNYLTMISGEPATVPGQADCLPPLLFGLCTFPASVPTIANQLASAGRTWKGYMEDMATPCRHPADTGFDLEQSATPASQYATRHNPFVFFHSITDDAADCAAHVVNLDALDADLASVQTTPSFSFITPDLCHDGHDASCADGGPGGYGGIDELLRVVVPKILASPAYQQDGLLLVAFDESDGPTHSEACCYQPNPLAGIAGPGGGRTGLLAISPFIAPGTESAVPYNHFSLLASLEDLFGLAHLAGAANAASVPFGTDVYNAAAPTTTAAPPSEVAAGAQGAPEGEIPATGIPTTALAALAGLTLAAGLLGRRALRRGGAT